MNTGSSPRPATTVTAADTRSSNGVRLFALFAFVLLLVVVALLFWFNSDSGPSLGWMAWTKPTAIFFVTILCLLILMCIWEAISPGGGPRIGILRFETTRGDRLFLSLLGSAFIHLAWLAFAGPDLWKALGVSVVYAILVFTLV